MKRRKLRAEDVTSRLRLIERRLEEDVAGQPRGVTYLSVVEHLESLRKTAEKDQMDLAPWAKRIRALENSLAVIEVMSS